jgi:uncharacterized protein (DUF58 family)
VVNPIDRQKIENFGSLEFRARQEVEGFITGLHKSPYHGFSVEFAEHRAYNKGESTRYIDWKLYARTEKLFTKKFDEETNLRCQLVLDVSPSMYFPIESDYALDNYDKIGFSVYAAAALIRMMQKQRDAVGLSLFRDTIFEHLEPRSNSMHVHHLYSTLEKLLEGEKKWPKANQSYAIQAIHEIAERIHKRSLVIIFSDLMDNSESTTSIVEALQHLKYYKHDVVVFGVFDRKQEIELDYDNRPRVFIDSETGARIKLNPANIQEFYNAQMKQYIHDLKVKCGQYEIDFVECDIHEGFHPVLLRYLVKRQKLY